MRVLVVNPGSSTLKLALVVDGASESSQAVPHDGIGEVEELFERWGPVDAVGIRFVHGGPDHLEPVAVTDGVLESLADACDLAPLHNPPALAAARALRAKGAPVVACFDTTFHTTLPPAAATYALPREWNQRWRLRRYGFHGLSYEYAARRAAELLGRPLGELRLVLAHLGGGASLCAVRDGRSVDTTMGFTPLDGLPMQVRSGAVDPGLLLWLLRSGGVGLDELADTLEHRSGLAGLSGTSGDIREVLKGVATGDPDAGRALEVYVHGLRLGIGAMAAAAGGLDALVFTGGVGAHTPQVRSLAVAWLGHLGFELDEELNEEAGCDRDIAASGARARVLVIHAREELSVARAVGSVLS